MHRWAWIFLLVLTIVALSIPAPAFVSAQSGGDIGINQVSTLETPTEMVLKIYFNFYEPTTGVPVLDADPASAQVTLLNTNQEVQGVVKKPDVPIYITLELDSSGSMAAAAVNLRQAAKLALANSPDDAYYSVIQFDEATTLIQDFTQNVSVINQAIDRYQVNSKGTCLYDAAYTAVESLGRAPAGRRAVILFTDGKDERSNGAPCSQHSYQDLVTLANQMQVPIDAIGLSGSASDLNSAELQNMASSTGGFSAIGSQADLSQSFGKIMDALNAQWMVQVSTYPRQGQNEARLEVNLKDNTSHSASFSFTSNTTYAGPPSPVTAQLTGLMFKPENSTYDLQLSLSSPELVSSIQVSIWDKKTGLKAAEYIFKDPTASNTLSFPTDALVVGDEYELHLSAISRSDNTAFPLAQDSQGNAATELVHDFTYDPSAFSPKMEVQSVTQQGNDLALVIATTNSGLISSFDGWLIDEATNTRLRDSDFTLPALGISSGTIVIPLAADKIPDGKYTLVVRVLGKDSQVYSSLSYAGVVYQASQPSLFQTIWAALVRVPILFGLILAILLGVVGYFIYMTVRSRSMTGIPVLQGQLGGKLSDPRQKKDTMLPLADQEPVPGRSPVSSQPASSINPPIASGSPKQSPGDQTRSAEAAAVSNPLHAGQPAAVRVQLTVERSLEDKSIQGQQILMAQFPFVIGRREGNLRIQDIDLSRRHAQITYDEARQTYYISDLNSSNGTKLDGVALVSGQAYALTSRSLIQLGPNVTVRFDLG